MASSLAKAIDSFPVVRWLSDRTQVWDNGGDNVWITCPVCKTRKKLGVHRIDKKSQCFKCNEGGAGGSVWDGRAGLIKLIEIVEGCDKRRAIDRIFELSGVQDVAWTPKELPPSQIPAGAIPLASCPQHPAVQMLHRRGCAHLIPTSFIAATGEYSHRVIMPVEWFGELLGFDAKAYGRGQPKSLFPEWQPAGAMHATAGWDHSADFAVVTESVLDAETIRVNAVGLLGSVLRPGQLVRLLRLRQEGVRRLVWFLDHDAWRKQYNAIFRHACRFENYVVRLGAGDDPNSLGYARCWELIAAATHVRDGLDLFFEEFSHPA